MLRHYLIDYYKIHGSADGVHPHFRFGSGPTQSIVAKAVVKRTHTKDTLEYSDNELHTLTCQKNCKSIPIKASKFQQLPTLDGGFNGGIDRN